MIRTLTASAALALAIAAPALAENETHVEDFDFSFEGMFGSYDQMQLQRGLQVFTQACASCHGMELVPIRSLAQEGGPALPADQVREYASRLEVWDPTLEDGFGDFRPAVPADHFPAGNFEGAPDLSLMAKARKGFEGPYGTGINQLIWGIGGPEYIASLLTGYADEPECALEGEPMDGYYNTAFAYGGFPDSCKIYEEREVQVEQEDGTFVTEIEKVEVGKMVIGSWIAMPPPLWGDDVEFADGSPTDLHSTSADVAAFLMWTAEPGLNARKSAGLTSVIFLSVLAVLLYLTNKRIWAPVKKGIRRET